MLRRRGDSVAVNAGRYLSRLADMHGARRLDAGDAAKVAYIAGLIHRNLEQISRRVRVVLKTGDLEFERDDHPAPLPRLPLPAAWLDQSV